MNTTSCIESLSKATLLAGALVALAVAQSSAQAADRPVRALILSGQNNHAWKATTPKLKEILAGGGRFAVEVTEAPERFDPARLASFDVLVSDWNAWGEATVKEWPAALRAAFLEFVRGGKGYVSIHAGSSSFYDWPEYQQIGGMYWILGVTSHGPPHKFKVTFPGSHPITEGLESFETTDELWVKPGVHVAARVVATGDSQPLAVTTSLGQGRGFALLLGHAAEYMENPGFQTLFRRGVEWAATGVVAPPTSAAQSRPVDTPPPK